MAGPLSYYGNYPGAESVPPLARPIVLAGAPGVGIGLIGASLCSLTGWPYVEIERAVEHDAGRAIAGLMMREGEAMVSARCWAHVARSLARRPHSVIAVPAIVLAPGPRLKHVQQHARLHHLTAPIDEQVDWLLQRSEREDGLAWFPAGVGGPPSVEVLHLAGAPVARSADVCHSVTPSAHLRTARMLKEALLAG